MTEIDYATVQAAEILEGDVFTHDGTQYRATSDAEYVRSQGAYVVRAEDEYGRVSFVELGMDVYEVTFVAEYAAV